MSKDLFSRINDTILDLQQSTLQTFPLHIRKLGRLLEHESLERVNAKLEDGLDLDEFIGSSEATEGSMVGSADLLWPDNDRKILGLQLMLIKRFSNNPDFMMDFGHRFYWSGSPKIISAIQEITRQMIIPFAREYKEFVLSNGVVEAKIIQSISRKIFIVHGHDREAREIVARFLERIGLEPIILNEQANQGRTIIEKVEANSDVGFAVVILTPDDLGRALDASELEPRARQNVLLELGYFMARLGRNRVCALRRGEVSIPSDFAGVVWEDFDPADGWKSRLARELDAAGLDFDWKRVST